MKLYPEIYFEVTNKQKLLKVLKCFLKDFQSSKPLQILDYYKVTSFFILIMKKKEIITVSYSCFLPFVLKGRRGTVYHQQVGTRAMSNGVNLLLALHT
jgi:hypothetical protein